MTIITPAEETMASITVNIKTIITAMKTATHILKIFIPTAAEIYIAEGIFKAVQEEFKAQTAKEISP